MNISDAHYHILAKLQSELYDRKFDSKLVTSAINNSNCLIAYITKDKNQAIIVDVVDDKIVAGYSFTTVGTNDFEVYLSDPDCFKNMVDYITTAGLV